MSFLPVLHGPRGPRGVAGCRSGATEIARNPCVKVGTFGPVCLPVRGLLTRQRRAGVGGRWGFSVAKSSVVIGREGMHGGCTGDAQA